MNDKPGKRTLRLSDGTRVRSLRELRRHYDIDEMLRLYRNGKLVRWLEDVGYVRQAAEIKRLDPNDEDSSARLFEILGIKGAGDPRATGGQPEESTVRKGDAGQGSRRKKPGVPARDRQAQLEQAIEGGATDIQLEGGLYRLPDVPGITYRGTGDTLIEFGSHGAPAGVRLLDANLSWDSYEEKLLRPTGDRLSAKLYMAMFADNEPLGKQLIWHGAKASDGRVLTLAGDVARTWDDGPGSPYSYYQSAAGLGFAPAQVLAGKALEKGEGTRKNKALAFSWYEKAAQQGYAPGMDALGDAYAAGMGVRRNAKLAFKWWLRAAFYGFAPSQHKAALALLNGTGTRRDEAYGMRWLQIAALRGVAEAAREMAERSRNDQEYWKRIEQEAGSGQYMLPDADWEED